ncbi:hypothetical protein E2C01_080980 [Portunus trituberculatus]|uniref:Uncharacterized protein n=1 Tax=Portunus trituberculatus TaxID=210409 RepID=A0A5B7J117_PORTR|nr:hypothetical protein [Portunus trituberculatus]
MLLGVTTYVQFPPFHTSITYRCQLPVVNASLYSTTIVKEGVLEFVSSTCESRRFAGGHSHAANTVMDVEVEGLHSLLIMICQ